MSDEVHPVFSPLFEFLSGKTKDRTDWCPHGRAPHEECEDCKESDTEELAL
jgi:hypothetical protein